VFYYPKMGYGMIVEKMADVSGRENIFRDSRITRILHDHIRIQEIEINGEKRIPVNEVVSTLPLNLFVRMMDPQPPENILDLARDLRFRNVLLIALFLNRESVSENASMYFPDPEFPFTRVYEPKNRSSEMSPPGKTSLIVELPCQCEDPVWKLTNEELTRMALQKLGPIFRIEENQILDSVVYRINNAYPILEKGFELKVESIFQYLKNFENLKLAGRNGKFTYTHIHNMMRFGKEVVDEYIS